MDIDYTSFLYAISGCAATIIAIIGGFIASKLISISSEREEISTKIKELDNELSVQTERKRKIENNLTEDEALDFVEDNIEKLLQGETIEDVYKNEEKYKVPIDTLRIYWNKATSILEDIVSCQSNSNIEFNSDGVINEMAIKYTDNYDYEICKLIFSEIKNQMDKQDNSYNGILHSVSQNALKGIPRNGVLWEQEMTSNLHKIENRIQEIEIQTDIYREKKKTVKKPKGMANGLLVFLSFSLGGIIYPLVCAFLFEGGFISGIFYGVIALLLFIMGIGITFIYLIGLLKWKE